MTRRAAALVAVLVAVLPLTGCAQAGFGGLYDVPLPGGADLGDRPFRVTAEFADVLDLVPQAAVKVNDVPVGRVASIDLSPDSRVALVTLEVNGDVVLPAATRAQLRQSSLLGEKFVDLGAVPGAPAHGRLAGGDRIPLDRTQRNPEVEEVLAALSLLLNQGGLGQVQNIVKELNAALAGNEPEVRSLLETLNRTVGRLDEQRGDITRAIDGMGRLSTVLAHQNEDVATTLDGLGPGLDVLDDQRDELVGALRALDRLSAVATDVVDRSRADLVADLRALTPTLQSLAKAGQDIPDSLQLLLTYPFTDYSLNNVRGDFVNLNATLDLDPTHVLGNLARSVPPLPVPPGGGGG